MYLTDDELAVFMGLSCLETVDYAVELDALKLTPEEVLSVYDSWLKVGLDYVSLDEVDDPFLKGINEEDKKEYFESLSNLILPFIIARKKIDCGFEGGVEQCLILS